MRTNHFTLFDTLPGNSVVVVFFVISEFFFSIIFHPFPSKSSVEAEAVSILMLNVDDTSSLFTFYPKPPVSDRCVYNFYIFFLSFDCHWWIWEDQFPVMRVQCTAVNPIYDCFPCQIFTFGRNSSDSSLYVIMDYQVDIT